MPNEHTLSAIIEVSENEESGLESENESESEGEDESGLTTGENDEGGYNTWSGEDSNAGSENPDEGAAANRIIPTATAVAEAAADNPQSTPFAAEVDHQQPLLVATAVTADGQPIPLAGFPQSEIDTSSPLLSQGDTTRYRPPTREGSSCCRLISVFGTLALSIYGINYLVNNNDKPGSGGAYTGIVMHPPANTGSSGEMVFQSKGNPPPYQTLKVVNAAMHPCTIKLNALAENNKVTWNLNLLNDKISFTWGQYADTKIGVWPEGCNPAQFGDKAFADVKINDNDKWVVPISMAPTPELAINNLRGSRARPQFPSLFGLGNTTDKRDSTQNAQDSSPRISMH